MNFSYKYGEEVFSIFVDQQGDVYTANINGDIYEFEIIKQEPGVLSIRVGNKVLTFHVAAAADKRWVAYKGCTYFLEKPSSLSSYKRDEQQKSNELCAPMPAQVIKIQIQEGEIVKAGESLLILEAMKMEIRIRAPHDSRIEKINVSEGQAVERDELLISLENVENGGKIL